MKLDAKKIYYLMIIVTVVSFCGIIAAFYWGNQQLESKAAVISDLQADRDIAQEKVLALKDAKKSADLASDAEDLLSKLLPKTKEQEKLIADVIYTASAEAGIPLQKLGALSFNSNDNPSDLSGTEQFATVPGVYSYPFNMSVEDISYETLLLLLKEIEQNGRLVQVENIEISPDKQSPGDIANVNLSLKAFLKP